MKDRKVEVIPTKLHFKAIIWTIVIASAFIMTRYFWPIPKIYPHPLIISTIPKPVNMAWPANGQAAVGILGQDVIASSPNQIAEPTASVAKTMLALCILQRYPLSNEQSGPIITIKPADVDIYNKYLAMNGSVIKVVSGEQLTEYQALEAMLLPSANNVADSMAIWAFGSMKNYLKAANQMAAGLGMYHSVFAGDASGYSSMTVSSANDLVLLGQAAIRNNTIRSIVDRQSTNLPVVGNVRNYNDLLGKDGVIGIKTGSSDQAGGVMLLAAVKTIFGRQYTIIAAINGQTSLMAATDEGPKLLNYVYNNFGSQKLVMAGQEVAYYKPPWQKPVIAYSVKSVYADDWLGKRSMLYDHLIAIKAAVAGSQVGTVGDGNNTSSVLISGNISSPSWWWRIIR